MLLPFHLIPGSHTISIKERYFLLHGGHGDAEGVFPWRCRTATTVLTSLVFHLKHEWVIFVASVHNNLHPCSKTSAHLHDKWWFYFSVSLSNTSATLTWTQKHKRTVKITASPVLDLQQLGPSRPHNVTLTLLPVPFENLSIIPEVQ